MFQVKKMDTPKSVPFANGTIVLTHTRISLSINPTAEQNAVVVVKNDGFIGDGRFQAFGEAEVSAMDAQGLDAMIASTEGGKRAGLFRTDDILPFIAKRNKEIADAEKAADEANKERLRKEFAPPAPKP